MAINRRNLLGAAAAGAATLASAVATPASGRTARRHAVPDAVTLFRKLVLRADDGYLFWWLRGPKMGQVGATLTTLYTSSIGTIQRVRHRSDGGIELTQLEMIIHLDPATGKPLENWRNPYTDELLPIKFNPVGPAVVRYRADNSRVLPTEVGGAPIEATATTHPPTIVGDDVFLRDESVARVFTPGRTRPFEVNDLAVYHGSLRNLSDPRTTVGDAAVFFAEVTGWQRWMNMGDRPGGLTSRLVGRKVRRYEDLPEDWRAHLQRIAPQIAADPLGALDEPAARFDR